MLKNVLLTLTIIFGTFSKIDFKNNNKTNNNCDIQLFSNNEENIEMATQVSNPDIPIGITPSSNLVTYNLKDCVYENRNLDDLRHLLAKYLNKEIDFTKELPYETNVQNNFNYGIVGDKDDRQLVSMSDFYPYSAVGQMSMTHDLKEYDAENEMYFSAKHYIGTCFMIGSNIALTNGHCVFGEITSDLTGEKISRFADSITVNFGNGSNNKITKKVWKSTIPEVYFDTKSYLYDWAILEFEDNVGNEVGWFDLEYQYDVLGDTVYTYGYPNDFRNSNDVLMMCKTSGIILGFEYENVYKTTLDIQGGQSGSPILIKKDGVFSAIGILGYSHLHDYSGGPFINLLMKATQISFAREYENRINFIEPKDYSFDDAYPKDGRTMNNYYLSTIGDFSFQTKRYRTGYIQNEYIVMSPIKTGITEAFIEYKFDFSISRIEVALSHWRELSNELLSSSTGKAELQIKVGDEWVRYKDLLSNEINLPRDRNNPNYYRFNFEEKVKEFRFYASIFEPINSERNKGRICIGNMAIFR